MSKSTNHQPSCVLRTHLMHFVSYGSLIIIYVVFLHSHCQSVLNVSQSWVPLNPWCSSVSLPPVSPCLSVPDVCEYKQSVWLKFSLINYISSFSICENGVWNCTGSSCPEVAYCPGDLVYKYGSCLLTCDTVDQNQTCIDVVDGCVCRDGTVLLVSLHRNTF